jgi:hypothetical protein
MVQGAADSLDLLMVVYSLSEFTGCRREVKQNEGKQGHSFM